MRWLNYPYPSDQAIFEIIRVPLGDEAAMRMLAGTDPALPANGTTLVALGVGPDPLEAARQAGRFDLSEYEKRRPEWRLERIWACPCSRRPVCFRVVRDGGPPWHAQEYGCEEGHNFPLKPSRRPVAIEMEPPGKLVSTPADTEQAVEAGRPSPEVKRVMDAIPGIISNNPGRVWETRADLAKEANASEETLDRALRRLPAEARPILRHARRQRR